MAMLLVGWFLFAGLSFGAPELFFGRYPTEVMLRHGLLLVTGMLVTLWMVRVGARLWWRWPLASFLILGSLTARLSSMPNHNGIEEIAAAKQVVAAVLALVSFGLMMAAFFQFTRGGPRSDTEESEDNG